MNIEIKSWITGEVLFELACENNTVKLTIEAAVRDGASLDGSEKLTGNRPVFQIGPIGSRCAYPVAYLTDNGIRISAGCFYGSLGDFESAVQKEHGDNIHGKEYLAAIELIRAHERLWGVHKIEQESK